MAGRRRRTSNSTVATVDESHIRYNKETWVLKPTAPNTPDHEWPCYILTDAQIYRSDGETLANPLHVSLEGSMVIKGRLVVDQEDDEANLNLIKPNTKTAYIEISRSERYSIGYNPITLWVSGAAGWYEVVPSPEYEAMYAEVQEAIKLYYSVMESYEVYNELREMQKKKKKSPLPAPGIEEILFDYATTLGDGIFYEEAVARCGKWAKFLISHFPKEPDLMWDETRFAQWIRQKHPDLTQKISDAAAGLILPAPIPPRSELAAHEQFLPRRQRRRSAATSARHSEDVEMSDPKPVRSASPSTQSFDKGKGKKLISITPVPLPSYLRQQPHASTSPAVSPAPSPALSPTPGGSTLEGTKKDLDTLINVFKEEADEKSLDLNKVGPAKFNQAIFFKCKIRDYRMSKEIVSYYAKDLLPLLPAEFRNKQFYNWLQLEALKPQTLPDGLTADKISEQLIRRARKTKSVTSGAEAPPTAPVPGSVTGRLTQTWDEEESEEDVRPRRSGKGAVLRPPISRKRPVEMDDDSASGSRRGRKSAKTSTPLAFEDDDLDDSSDQDNVMEEGPTSSILPPKDVVRVIVHAEQLPTISPSGPNGTWICDQEGCGHVVRGADDQAGEEVIKSHFKWHESQAEKINLAMAESRGQMPINHLLDKLQTIGKKVSLKRRGTFPNGELLAAPIKRKLVI